MTNLLFAIGFLNFTMIDLVDILLVAVLVFTLFRWLKGSSAMNIMIAIVGLLLIRVIADAVNMRMTSTVLGAIIDVGTVALIVIFQPEIRQFLNKMGKSTFSDKQKPLIDRLLKKSRKEMDSETLDELATACFEMGADKVGALIVLPRMDELQSIIETGDIVDAKISKRLIENIFFKNSPLHDGAMILSADRVVAARCTLPISGRKDIPPRYGMRHKAAIGISERTDATVVVVSEQTGGVSIVREGVITPVKNINTLKTILSDNGSKDEAGSKDRV